MSRHGCPISLLIRTSARLVDHSVSPVAANPAQYCGRRGGWAVPQLIESHSIGCLSHRRKTAQSCLHTDAFSIRLCSGKDSPDPWRGHPGNRGGCHSAPRLLLRGVSISHGSPHGTAGVLLRFSCPANFLAHGQCGLRSLLCRGKLLKGSTKVGSFLYCIPHIAI